MTDTLSYAFISEMALLGTSGLNQRQTPMSTREVARSLGQNGWRRKGTQDETAGPGNCVVGAQGS